MCNITKKVTYLNDILNCQDFAVIHSGRGVFRNFDLAGQCFLCILVERVSNQLAQLLKLPFNRTLGTVFYCLLQTELDFCFFGGEVAGRAKNSHYVTYEKENIV